MQHVSALKGGFFMNRNRSDRLYAHPFCLDYWRDAMAEFRDVRVLVFAALMIALRVATKPFQIPIGPSLNINLVQMIVNAVGAMTFGPVVAAAAAAVTDVVGYLVFPDGPYFFPFIFTEIAGSVIFALFLYRADISLRRVILCRFCMVFLVNIVLQSPIMLLYYRMILGKEYTLINGTRIIKNLLLFPAESVLLTLLLRSVVPPLHRLKFIVSRVDGLRLDRRCLLVLGELTLISGLAVWLYYQKTLDTVAALILGGMIAVVILMVGIESGNKVEEKS